MLIDFVGDTLRVVQRDRLWDFPNPVNETSARLVAAGVILQAVLFLVFREGWLLALLTYGFAARVATGPTLSPLGQIVTRVATPALERARPSMRSRQVPGPPKRFAQAIGLGFTSAASIAWVAGADGVAVALIALLTVAAGLEAIFGICLGCIAYSALFGCADCDDISDRLRRAVEEAREEVPAVADAPAMR